MKITILDSVYSQIEKVGIPIFSPLLSYVAEYWKQGPFRKERREYQKSLMGKDGVFLTGFIPKIINEAKKKSIPIEWEGAIDYIEPTTNEPELKGITFRPDQLDLIRTALVEQRGVLQAPTGVGKCLGKGTPILLFNGSIKNVEEITPGDLLMGPDSKPRRVISIARGKEKMYKIKPIKGEPFCCNKSHILSLKITGNKGRIVNIPINEYFKKSRTFRHYAKLWRTGVDFKTKPTESFISPYILGIWLGDGGNIHPSGICNPDKEIIDEIHKFAEKSNMMVKNIVEGNSKKCPIWCITRGKGKPNPFIRELRRMNLPKNKHVPNEFKINNRNTRLEILAGLIDSDGSYGNGCYGFSSKRKQLADDVAFLARSLGLAAYVKETRKKCQGWTECKTYYAVGISGDCSIIPCRVKRKQAHERKQKKDTLKTGFSIFPIGTQEYFGFEIDGDGLFLLGDFTVTHNTILALGIISCFEESNILFLCHEKTLMNQTYDEMIDKGFNRKEINKISGDSPDKSFNRITIAMMQTFGKLLGSQYTTEYFDVVFVDETDVAMSLDSTYYKILTNLIAPVRYGLTATLPNEQSHRLVLEGLVGPVIGHISIKNGVDLGLLAKPIIKIKKIPYSYAIRELRAYKDVYTKGIVENKIRNNIVVDETIKLMQEGKTVLVLVVQTEHGQNLANLFKEKGHNVPFVWGATEVDERTAMKNALQRKDLKCLIASIVFRRGINIPSLGAVVNASGGKSETVVLQGIGRGLRKTDDKNSVTILDFLDLSHPFLVSHVAQRLELYSDEGWL